MPDDYVPAVSHLQYAKFAGSARAISAFRRNFDPADTIPAPDPGCPAAAIQTLHDSRYTKRYMLALDGIYAEDEVGCLRFHQAAPPSDAEVARVTERIQRRIAKLLERRGLGRQSEPGIQDCSLFRLSPSCRVP